MNRAVEPKAGGGSMDLLVAECTETWAEKSPLSSGHTGRVCSSRASKTSPTIFNKTGHTGGVHFDAWLWNISAEIFDARQNRVSPPPLYVLSCRMGVDVTDRQRHLELAILMMFTHFRSTGIHRRSLPCRLRGTQTT